MDNNTVSVYAHQFSTGVARELGHNMGVTADLIWVERQADRDTVDLNLPTRSRVSGRIRSSRASTTGSRRPTTPIARCS